MIIQANELVSFEVRDGSVDDAAVVREMWTENVYQLHPGDLEHSGVMVDIGANIGAVTVWAATQCPQVQVLAVEPEPENRALLERNLFRNSVTSRVTVLPVAVSGEPGVGFITAEHGCSRLRPIRFPDTAEVPVIGLDELLSDIPAVDVLKIDVEGSEYSIIAGASLETLAKVRYLTMEFHGAPDDIFGAMVARLAHVFNVHMFGSPDRGGALYGRRY